MVDSNLQLFAILSTYAHFFLETFSYFIIVQVDEMDNANFIVDKCLSSGQ